MNIIQRELDSIRPYAANAKKHDATQVAKVASIAIHKAIKRTAKKFIAISCHYDILEWLEPDWVFDTNEMKCFFGNARILKKYTQCENAGLMNGQNLGAIII